MNPKHKTLAQEECAQLQAQGLIEPTDSQCPVKPFMLIKGLNKNEVNTSP
jgi:hypothetical protein